MESPVTISTTAHGDTEFVVISGEVDLVSASAVEEALVAAVGRATAHVVADLKGVSFLDSSGLRALIVGREHATASGIGFRIDSPQPVVERVLQVTGVAESFGL